MSRRDNLYLGVFRTRAFLFNLYGFIFFLFLLSQLCTYFELCTYTSVLEIAASNHLNMQPYLVVKEPHLEIEKPHLVVSTLSRFLLCGNKNIFVSYFFIFFSN